MLRWSQTGLQWRVTEAENARKHLSRVDARLRHIRFVKHIAKIKGEPAKPSVSRAGNQKSEDDFDLVVLLKVCATQKDVHRGNHLHAEAVKHDLIKQNVFIGNTLINVYAKCNVLDKAQQVFNDLPYRTLVSWTALIVGYAEQGHGKKALDCYEQMITDGHTPDGITLAGLLKACGSTGAADKGKLIHAAILREGLLAKFIKLGSALIDMYAKCGALTRAREVFDELPVQNLVSWTTLIGGYSQQEHGAEALNCFEMMKDKGLSPDGMTFSCILKACGILGANSKGQEIHAEIARLCLLDGDTVLVSALVDMYSKCAEITKAREVFDRLHVHDAGSWTVLITGYSQGGNHKAVLDSFDKMIKEGVEPNPVTFVIVLNACSYLNLVVKGQQLFHLMREKFAIIPNLDHHTCMVGILGHAGDFKQALEEIKRIPLSNFLPAWLTLLAACRKWGNVDYGKVAFGHAVRLDKKSTAAYFLMNSIYAAAGMQEDADRIEAMRRENEAWILEEDRDLMLDQYYA